MSRSALERREQIAFRKGQLEQPRPNLEEEREVKSNELKIHGNSTTYNLNQLLANNIYECDYFRALYQLKTYHEVIDEIYVRVTNAEPWATGTSRLPSTAFCLLYKFFTMRLTRKQIHGLLNHQDSPYIRCIGFLYLRYVCDPKELWAWFSPYLDDPEEFAAGSDPNDLTTMGQWVVKLLTELQYFGTLLPRIPVPIERKIKMRLVLQEEKRKRAKVNRRMMHAFRQGAKVKAIYEDEDNDPAWYDAVIDSVEEDEMFLVTFPEYGNQELVGLGDLMMPGAGAGGGGGKPPAARESPEPSRRRSRSRSRDRDRKRGRSRSRSRSRSRERRRGGGSDDGDGYGETLLGKNLMEAVMKREREASAAVGKDYAQRPASYKGSLSLQMDRFTHRKKSRSRSAERPSTSSSSSRRRSPSPSSRSSRPPPVEERKKPSADSEKMRKLKEAYGDASTSRDYDN